MTFDYVDCQLSANLDSTNAFEGPEKLLEVWFWADRDAIPPTEPQAGLRSLPFQHWVDVLDLVNCKVLSVKRTRTMDAYLLSESSLFVFDNRMVLKTCGTTTTLACLDHLFASVGQHFPSVAGGGQSIHKVFYSRRSFMFPDRQVHVHTDWTKEVGLLNQYFPNGKSYIVGDFTSDDHWYLYQGGQGRDVQARPGTNHDQTFEILMTQLDEDKAQQFVVAREPGESSMGVDEDLGHQLGRVTMSASGLADIFGESDGPTHLPSPSMSDDEEPEKATGFVHDAFSFTPCGFSSNSISPSGYYYTLHITPESGWSYASFETNYPFGNATSEDIVVVLQRVLSVFGPRKFSVTLFAEGSPENAASFAALQSSDAVLAKHGYTKNEKIVYDLRGGYSLLYLNFARHDVRV
ncbi:hypothetical protein DIURU_005185 [Diutina rugosa]|uniref:adenosylmethionine decarboxylase n=1 Tax=Diutina rugosa TaxID=5481 RepID=A0A642UEJ7_DIURU|nr:uncharacterized protein DIURU_005185 [Diutina rugosa]KAA8897586.1 hypothetical protein DIURU_005185 [Diutina rugosa]